MAVDYTGQEAKHRWSMEGELPETERTTLQDPAGKKVRHTETLPRAGTHRLCTPKLSSSGQLLFGILE